MSLAASIGLASYRLAGRLAGPIARRKLRRRIAQGKEDAARLEERFGRASVARPSGLLIWMHGASVGEALAGLVLIEAIRKVHGDLSFLVTTGTVTSAGLLADRLPENALHQYVPLDLPAAVDRFLDHWRPDAALWLESEFWPNILMELSRRRIPHALVNGRISPASYSRWSSLRPIVAELLSGFDVCLAQTERDASRLRNLGARNTVVTGNLKESAPPLVVDAAQLADMRALIGCRPVWIAASTHPGEEEIVLAIHGRISGKFPNLLTIIVPRHPERGRAIGAIARDAGLSVAVRSSGARPLEDCEIYVADTIGELGLWYRLAPIAFIGKTLVGEGGQNPLEPAQLACAVMFGPAMSNFEEIARGLVDHGAALEVTGQADLAEALETLLGDSARCAAMGQAGRAFIAGRAGASGEALKALKPMLTAMEGRASVGSQNSKAPIDHGCERR